MTTTQIKKHVARYYGISPSLIDKKSRKRHIIIPRQITHYLCCKFTPDSLLIIGERIGDKSHALVIHSKKTIENMIETNYRYMGEPIEMTIRNLSRIINNKVLIKYNWREYLQIYDMKNNRYVSEKFLMA